MIAEKFYIDKFLTQAEADRLLAFSLGLPPTRGVTQPWKNLNPYVSLGQYTEFPSPHIAKKYGAPVSLATAPIEVRTLAETLTEFAGRPINYLSFVAYMNERDHMGFHQHKEDWNRLDQTVWVVSLGEVRAVTLRPLKSKDKSKYETIYPAHGSLYILPSSYNVTHEHEVSRSKTPGVRVSINCKSIPAPSQDAPAEKAGPRPQIRWGSKTESETASNSRRSRSSVRITTTIEREWLAEIIAGTKKIEYRQIKPYWTKRFAKVSLPFELRLLNGMHPPVPEVTVLIHRITKDRQAGEYRLHIKKVLNYKHWDKRKQKPQK